MTQKLQPKEVSGDLEVLYLTLRLSSLKSRCFLLQLKLQVESNNLQLLGFNERIESGNWSPLLSVSFPFLSVNEQNEEERNERSRKRCRNKEEKKDKWHVEWTTRDRVRYPSDARAERQSRSFTRKRVTDRQDLKIERWTEKKQEAKTIKRKEQGMKQKGTRHHSEWRGGKEGTKDASRSARIPTETNSFSRVTFIILSQSL